MRNKQKITFNAWGNTSLDYYEAAYQKIYRRISSRYRGIRLSELPRMTLVEIRRRLKLHITLEDIDIYNYRNWSSAKRLEWLEDLQIFAAKTLGKSEIKKLRGFLKG